MPNEGTAIVSARPAFEVDGQARAPLDAGLLRLSVRDGVDGLATCEAEFGNWGLNAQEQLGFLWFQRDVLEFGKRLLIKLGDDTLFDGLILAIEGRFPPNMPPTLVVRADDKLQALRMNRRTRHFEGASDADVVRQVANDHGLQADVNLSGPTWPLLVQANESDLAFLRRRMLVADADLVLRGDQIQVQQRAQRPRPALTLTHGGSLRSIQIAADLAHQRTSLSVGGWDVANKEALAESADSGCVSSETRDGDSGPQVLQQALGERKDTVAHRMPPDSTSARSEAEAHLRALSRRFLRGLGETDTDVRLRPGACVQLDGLGPLFSGAYGLTEVTHRFDTHNGLRTEFSVERAWIGRP
ncbi:MAG: phage late control D family protein [Burkholderiales bacterium]|nr:phage late control D family protein [Burkholderiales bacterium]MBH2015763.1 phage late control D family protein [Burkholderiales bacterium]